MVAWTEGDRVVTKVPVKDEDGEDVAVGTPGMVIGFIGTTRVLVSLDEPLYRNYVGNLRILNVRDNLVAPAPKRKGGIR